MYLNPSITGKVVNFNEDIIENAGFYLDFIELRAKRLIGRHSPRHVDLLLDDVSQEIYIKLLTNRHQYDSERDLAPWINKIIHNEVITKLKKSYTETTRTEPVEFTNFEGTIVENPKIIQFSKKIFDQGSSEQDNVITINEILDYIMPKLTPIQRDILECYLNPPKKFRKFIKKLSKQSKQNNNDAQRVHDYYVMKYLGISHQKMNTAKNKFWIYIQEWIELE